MTTHQHPLVLLVEDDRATREMFDYGLRLSGFDVIAVTDGLSALRFLDQELPDAVVLDVQLPQVSGIDVHAELLAHTETRAIPIIVVTGSDWRPPAGVFRVLRKPITADVVVQAIQEALDSPDADDPDQHRVRRRR